MGKREFLMQLNQHVDNYIKLAEEMCDVLTELKKSLLAFNTRKLNKLLDEKLVMNEQILAVNQLIEQMMIERYGEFSKSSSVVLIDEFPDIRSPWQRLQDLMVWLKTELSEVKRVLAMIDKYNKELQDGFEQVRTQHYNRQAHLTSKA